MNSFHSVKRSIRYTIWSLWGVYVKQFIVEDGIWGKKIYGFFTTTIRRYIRAWVWQTFRPIAKRVSSFSQRIRHKIHIGERALSPLKPLKVIRWRYWRPSQPRFITSKWKIGLRLDMFILAQQHIVNVATKIPRNVSLVSPGKIWSDGTTVPHMVY